MGLGEAQAISLFALPSAALLSSVTHFVHVLNLGAAKYGERVGLAKQLVCSELRS